MRRQKSYWLDCPYCGHPFDWDDVCVQLPTEPVKENEGEFEVKCPLCRVVFTVVAQLELVFDVGGEGE